MQFELVHLEWKHADECPVQSTRIKLYNMLSQCNQFTSGKTIETIKMLAAI